VAQQEFDARVAWALDDMANRIEGKTREGKDAFESAFERLEQTVRNFCSERPERVVTEKLQTFLALSGSSNSLITSLEKEILC